MSAISPILKSVIEELQQFASLKSFVLGGGTNLALRYNHRKSIDIDLFSNEIIGKKGFDAIVKEVTEHYGDTISGVDFPCNIDDQYIFLRFFIQKSGTFIKVEVLQNFQRLNNIEVINTIKLLTTTDIGLLKLMSASNRATQKDIYDLDFITDSIPLYQLYNLLKEKEERFQKEIHKTIFSLDHEKSPVQFPETLLKFDELKNNYTSRPSHSNDRIDILEGSKTWREARFSWLQKVRQLFRELDIPYPKPKGLDLE